MSRESTQTLLSFVHTTSQGRRLHGLIDLPAQAGRRPAVVVCHGFKGFMEWGFFPLLAELLAERGFVVARFNFSGSGMRPGEEKASDLEGFRTNTFSADLEDALSILDAVAADDLVPGRIDAGRVGLLGHSRGGGAALLAAASEAWRERLGALVTWASVGTFQRYGEDQKRAWREAGEIVVVNGRTGQELPMATDLLDDLEANAEALDLEAAASRRQAPWLILHGDEDETVEASDARRLAAAAADPHELRLVTGGGHTFGAGHPFNGPTPQLIEVFNQTQRWFRRYLT
jgi:dienelactone hydrolase